MDVVPSKTYLQLGFREARVQHCQAKESLWRRIRADPYQVERFPGANDPLKIRVPSNHCFEIRNGSKCMCPALEVGAGYPDQLITQGHQVVERQHPCQIQPRPRTRAEPNSVQQLDFTGTDDDPVTPNALSSYTG